jgi:predicted DsbA family dithiol-disulfide isomerase
MTTEPTGQVRLDIFADPVCPWCLIGKAELDRALESRPGHPFAIHWQPFRLDPQMPPAGMPYTAYMKMKFGNEAGIIEVMRPVMAASERLGLWINPSLIERVPGLRACRPR